MISLAQYWMGRDEVYASELTDEIRSNAAHTVAAINVVLGAFSAATGIVLTTVASGWRPPEVNCETSNAADHSKHLIADAGDIRDTPNRDLARWCATNQKVLVEAGVWCERFEWTPTWVHFQIVPPTSKLRFFRPSMAPAKCERLPEQDTYGC